MTPRILIFSLVLCCWGSGALLDLRCLSPPWRKNLPLVHCYATEQNRNTGSTIEIRREESLLNSEAADGDRCALLSRMVQVIEYLLSFESFW